MTTDKHAKRAARELAEREQISYTAARRHLAEQQQGEKDVFAVKVVVTERPKQDFGGHDFGYERDTDLFRCSECRAYEIVVRADDGSIARCPGLESWGGDTERIYLLVTVDPALTADGWNTWVTQLAWQVRGTGLGRGVSYGWAGGQMLFETVPGVADELEGRITRITLDQAGRQTLAAASVERLSVEDGQAFIAQTYAAYVAKYGEPDR